MIDTKTLKVGQHVWLQGQNAFYYGTEGHVVEITPSGVIVQLVEKAFNAPDRDTKQGLLARFGPDGVAIDSRDLYGGSIWPCIPGVDGDPWEIVEKPYEWDPEVVKEVQAMQKRAAQKKATP